MSSFNPPVGEPMMEKRRDQARKREPSPESFLGVFKYFIRFAAYFFVDTIPLKTGSEQYGIANGWLDKFKNFLSLG